MKILLLGAKGMLGTDIHLYFLSQGHKVMAFSKDDVDIRDKNEVDRCCHLHRDADFIINCAAFTKVDACEARQNEAFDINAEGAAIMAHIAKKYRLCLVHFSTDYVFSGTKNSPYVETDTCDPINIYGESKYQGELEVMFRWPHHYIFRLQWLFGLTKHTHFVKTVTELVNQKEKISIVNDQWGSPTWTIDVARTVHDFLSVKASYGIYHLTSQGYTTWFDYAHHILDQYQDNTPIKPITSDEFFKIARRPKNGRLSIEKFLHASPSPTLKWRDAVEIFIDEYKIKHSHD